MNRRLFLLIGAMLLTAGGEAAAQHGKPRRIGWLASNRQADSLPYEQAFLAGMRERGYVLGEHFVLEMRYSDGDARRFPMLADELIALNPDVLLGFETPARAMAAKTRTIPIVLVSSIDPVAAGLVKNLARPGTNVTGAVGLFDQLIEKHVELLVELVPKSSRLALLNDPLWSAADNYERVARRASVAKGLALTVFPVSDANSVRETFAELAKTKPDGVIVSATGATVALRNEIVQGARLTRLPVIYPLALFANSGGLLSYGISLSAHVRHQLVDYVDRILKGAKPSDLPLQQPTTYEFVVNLKAAREIGITVPASILLRADQVIE